jgi:hypothetical protein
MTTPLRRYVALDHIAKKLATHAHARHPRLFFENEHGRRTYATYFVLAIFLAHVVTMT